MRSFNKLANLHRVFFKRANPNGFFEHAQSMGNAMRPGLDAVSGAFSNVGQGISNAMRSTGKRLRPSIDPEGHAMSEYWAGNPLYERGPDHITGQSFKSTNKPGELQQVGQSSYPTARLKANPTPTSPSAPNFTTQPRPNYKLDWSRP